jgi:peptidoglycan/LPS O-acetylase OafA/YrhL
MTTVLQTPAPHLETDATPPLPGEPAGGEPRKFRPDIEGIRALAVLLVVLYHAHLLGVSGGYVGVDVFFVLSGFLITRQLVAGIDKRGIRELPSFYSRRIKRLLPASTTVVVCTIVASYFWVPALTAKAFIMDAAFTTFYGLNYRLAYNGTSYLHQGSAVSPLQHFWSLGVEEQFYVAWPLLIALCMVLPLRARYAALVTLLSGICAVSFWFSATTTVSQPSWAYFGLHTRAWELAAGGLIALSAPLWTRLNRWVADIAAWGGFVTILACGWMLNDSTVYPGVKAAIPVGACAIVLAAGCAQRKHSIERLLGEPAIQGIGKVSYSWYLWHWPMLILFPYIAGEALPWPRRVEVVVLSLGVAILSYHIVENPVRHLSKLNFEWYRLAAALAGVVIAVAVIANNTLITTGTGVVASTQQIDTSTPGVSKRLTALLNASVAISKAPRNLTPKPAVAINDVAVSSKAGCLDDFTQVKQPACLYGDLHATRTAAVFGDSHMAQYSTGLVAAAKKQHWRLLILNKSACTIAQVSVYAPALKRMYTECDQWRALSIQRILAAKPQLVIMSQSDDAPGGQLSAKVYARTTAATVQKFRDAHIKVTFLLDTPFPGKDIPTCVASHLSSVQDCTFTRAHAYTYPARRTAMTGAVSATGAKVIDPVNWFCGTTTCPVVTGNILIWRDTGHMTATYSAWISPLLRSLLPPLPSGA